MVLRYSQSFLARCLAQAQLEEICLFCGRTYCSCMYDAAKILECSGFDARAELPRDEKSKSKWCHERALHKAIKEDNISALSCRDNTWLSQKKQSHLNETCTRTVAATVSYIQDDKRSSTLSSDSAYGKAKMHSATALHAENLARAHLDEDMMGEPFPSARDARRNTTRTALTTDLYVDMTNTACLSRVLGEVQCRRGEVPTLGTYVRSVQQQRQRRSGVEPARDGDNRCTVLQRSVDLICADKPACLDHSTRVACNVHADGTYRKSPTRTRRGDEPLLCEAIRQQRMPMILNKIAYVKNWLDNIDITAMVYPEVARAAEFIERVQRHWHRNQHSDPVAQPQGQHIDSLQQSRRENDRWTNDIARSVRESATSDHNKQVRGRSMPREWNAQTILSRPSIDVAQGIPCQIDDASFLSVAQDQILCSLPQHNIDLTNHKDEQQQHSHVSQHTHTPQPLREPSYDEDGYLGRKFGQDDTMRARDLDHTAVPSSLRLLDISSWSDINTLWVNAPAFVLCCLPYTDAVK